MWRPEITGRNSCFPPVLLQLSYDSSLAGEVRNLVLGLGEILLCNLLEEKNWVYKLT
jgi:hypothetical protein